MKIAIAAAAGNVAGRALEKIVEHGAEAVALVRHPEKVPSSLRDRVRIEIGSLEDAAFVAGATRGVGALLWLTPTTFGAEDFREHTLGLARNAAHAIRENGIRRVVFVSSHGADRAGIGHVSFAGEAEKILAAAAPSTMALRSAGFMENLLSSIDALKSGELFGVLPPAKTYPLVATRDVGDVAAKWLLDGSWSGHHVRGVHGPTDVSANDQVAILSRVLERPIRYRHIPAAALRAAFVKRGASASVADAYEAVFAAFAHADYAPTEKRNEETTTPTTLETFAREILRDKIG